jgi:UDP-glucose 4-epimerase
MRLLEGGERVIATSRGPQRRFSAPGLEWREVKLASFDAWPELLDSVSVVYHLGWSTTPASADSDPVADHQENVVGSLRLLHAVKPGARLVFASSGGAVYGRLSEVPVPEKAPTSPISVHGMSKLAVENAIHARIGSFGLDAAILRIGNAYGPGQAMQPAFGVVANYCRRALAGQPVVMFGDGSAVRDYIYIDDVAEALVLAGRSRLSRHVLNIGSGIGRSLLEVVRTIEHILGRAVPVRHEPARAFDVPVSVLDVRCAQEVLGWRARVPFEEGVRRTLAAVESEQARP